jgi:hypothetical protein
MKNFLKFILVLAIVIAGGYYGASLMQDKGTDQELEARLIDSSVPLEIQMEGKITLEVDDWLQENFSSGIVVGGKEPLKITSEGLPIGVQVKLNNRKIELSGLARESGQFNASISVVDKEGRSALKNLNLTLKQIKLSHEQLLKERTNWLDKNKKPTYELIQSYDGFALITNWLLSSNNS